METYSEKLNELLPKAKNSKNKRAKNEAALILIELFSENKDYNTIVNWFVKFPHSVCEEFFKQYRITDDEAECFLNAFKKNKCFNKKNNVTVFNRGLVLCEAFLRYNINKSITAELSASVIFNGKLDNGFSAKMVEYFQKYIRDKGQLDNFISLLDTLKNKADKDMILSFLADVEKSENKDTSNESNSNGQDSSVDKTENGNITEKRDLEEKSLPDNSLPKKTAIQHQLVVEQLRNISQTLVEQVNNLTNTNSIISTLKTAVENGKNAIDAKEAEILRLNQELEDCKQRRSDLAVEKAALEEKICKQSSEIANLNERLKTAFQMDTLSKNQELETLVKNVSDTLKAEYDEYCSSDTIFNEDNFQANYASLQRIFKILKRFGFNFE